MAYQNPSVDDFKQFFSRDFPYGTDPATSVTDSDITKAFVMTNISISQGLFCSQGAYTQGYLFLSAHYLVTNLQSSSQGIGGGFSFLEQSKSVGNVSASYSIPQSILDNPYFSMIAKTNYGAQYLFMVLPNIVGPISVVPGRTLP